MALVESVNMMVHAKARMRVVPGVSVNMMVQAKVRMRSVPVVSVHMMVHAKVRVYVDMHSYSGMSVHIGLDSFVAGENDVVGRFVLLM